MDTVQAITGWAHTSTGLARARVDDWQHWAFGGWGGGSGRARNHHAKVSDWLLRRMLTGRGPERYT